MSITVMEDFPRPKVKLSIPQNSIGREKKKLAPSKFKLSISIYGLPNTLNTMARDPKLYELHIISS